MPVVRISVSRLRLEVLICAALGVLLAGLTLAMAVSLPSPVQDLSGTFEDLIAYDRDALVITPILIAVVLATSLVAAELDLGTAVFAWSIALSRPRWFFEMAAIGLTMVLLLWLPIGAASYALGSRLGPMLDAQLSPLGLDPSPALMLSRAMVVFALVCLVGSISGRIVPTLLIGAIAGFLLLGIFTTAIFLWREPQIVPIDPTQAGLFPMGTRLATLDGRIASDEEAHAAARLVGPEFTERYQMIPVGLSPSTHTAIVLEESFISAVGTLAILISTCVVVERRRPI